MAVKKMTYSRIQKYISRKDFKDMCKQYKYQDDVFDWCRYYDIPIPIFEFKFDPDRKFKADLAYPTRNLLIEIEGGAWISGRHNRGSGFIKDMEKYNIAALRGYFVLRFTPQQIENGQAFKTIKEFLDEGKEG